MQLDFSFIIPVYNRPQEIEELLHSFTQLNTNIPFEVVIIEDGSTQTSKAIIEKYKDLLSISYFFKENTGPGDSRNFGMQNAKGNYFIILDSDIILPSQYLDIVAESLKDEYVDCFGGPDAAHDSFSSLQKAINFSMTSVITTGGIRGSKNSIDAFQPRSFNMGISKDAFTKTDGFGRIHPGEDPDLSIRLKKLGFKTKLISEAFVYHKRRISWYNFYKQVHKFGLVRPILNAWHPRTKKITYWFPSLFSSGFLVAIVLLFFKINILLWVYISYFVIAFVFALIKTKNIRVSIYALLAICVQFFGYGYGFIKATFAIQFLRKKPEDHFPELFFNKRCQ